MANEDVMVKLMGDQLNIYKKNIEGPGWGRLTKRRWKEEEANIKHQLTQRRWRGEEAKLKQVKKVEIYKVDVGEACKDLFTFISTCTHCNTLEVDNVIDGREKNSELSCRLCDVLDRLRNLTHIDIRDTDLSEGGGQVLSSISHPDLRVLILWDNKLYSQGEELKAALTKLPQLKFLNLNDSGLGGEELLCGLTQLPSSSPLLQGLAVAGHDLSSGGDQLVQVVEALRRLIFLNIRCCQIVSSVLCQVLEKINTDIEVLSIHSNEPVTDRQQPILDHINECKSLTYMHVSSSQWSPAELSQLNSLLLAHGGRLLVGVDPGYSLWNDYNEYVNGIADDCLS